MRYQPNVLDSELSVQLTNDFARALTGARPESVQQTQLQFIYDVLRSLAEARHLGFAHHTELEHLDELMAQTQQLQADLMK